MSRPKRDGLVWEDGVLDLEPRWAREPSVDAINKVCRRKLGVDCDVSFYAQGAFNKLHLVTSPNGDKSLMRMSLPVHPGQKTRGEVATLRWLRRWTEVPVPSVLAFDDSSDNEIGIAGLYAHILNHNPERTPFRGIGTLDIDRATEQTQNEERQDKEQQKPHQQGADLHVAPGEIVSLQFFWGEHYDYDVSRGPFRSSHDWLHSFLQVVVLEYESQLREAEDDEERQDVEAASAVAHKLLALLPKIFPTIQHPAEQSFLWHNDLSLQNMLVDDGGKITAVLDWECVSAVPRWAATKTPKFLSGKAREEEPNHDGYADEQGEFRRDGDDDDELDNEGKDELYWIHLLEYEKTRLRRVYAARMEALCPGWAAEVEDGALRRDFLEAVHRCLDGFHLRGVARLVDAIEAGEFRRLEAVLQMP
ncbi:hypothetical protein CPLU01_11822 [Colletotrichum plurivorum]|uniref:Aminoglycoside phosphotransferase domain-containing protein n=1 Tax=Colletotrichum plurivorum TaxID=2175906 RepID=A0A8H6N730_9PEZI|nr:hypothetical protein CPLU01_11822 [Colletotrichum plurivorum]